ncbi:hypothetical protein [Bacillus suaedaesalsae]|uniref:Uncharacterized protein n=1 Tax=Bacillus suaedaesalsae TaxID=2810349 RepID=A0ABS2DJP4_9BACI|nr:hypothetical protein [Bacillus suaedaesalsae]MBM6618715.1 hypothetical protein [Bacillus suaedaesalsae]
MELIFLFLAAVLAGLALLFLPTSAVASVPFLATLMTFIAPIVFVIVLIFALVILYKAIRALLGR